MIISYCQLSHLIFYHCIGLWLSGSNDHLNCTEILLDHCCKFTWEFGTLINYDFGRPEILHKPCRFHDLCHIEGIFSFSFSHFKLCGAWVYLVMRHSCSLGLWSCLITYGPITSHRAYPMTPFQLQSWAIVHSLFVIFCSSQTSHVAHNLQTSFCNAGK